MITEKKIDGKLEKLKMKRYFGYSLEEVSLSTKKGVMYYFMSDNTNSKNHPNSRERLEDPLSWQGSFYFYPVL